MVFRMFQLILERLRLPLKTTANTIRPYSPVVANVPTEKVIVVFTDEKPPRPRAAHPRRARTDHRAVVIPGEDESGT